MKSTTLLLSLVLALPLTAQDPTPKLACEEARDRDGRAEHCQMKEWTIPAQGRASVDAGQNGGVAVKGWSRPDVLVRAKIQTWAPTESEAQGLQSQVQVQTAGGTIRADGPQFDRGRGFAVSYEVFVPRRLDLSLKAHNGGISVHDVTGRMDFQTVNGGVSLARLGGSVKGGTVNGGIRVELSGARWEGEELDVRTTNGGVSLAMPANYSARLEAGTVNGGFKSEVGMAVQGEISKKLTGTIGSGGALIRVQTTNGGVHIRKLT